ncbi:amidohydrolase [Treponema sp.]|uniref:amidohydrolase n=1 Tax=Treponema sp. TaxID=166 RepID=UPI00298E6A06|nr:amidohydrolase [Treponema sp.]MCQ2241361.1 amidohydrolase [Treponema sp.]
MIFSNIKMLDENFKVLENMFVQTKDEKISYIGTTMPEKTSAEEEIYDGKGKFLMNGFFNTHCHVPMTILRGYGEGLSLQDWLFTKIFPFEAKLTAEDIYWTTKLGAMELIASGCASISDMYFRIEDEAKALDECGMKANICNGVTSFDPNEDLANNRGWNETWALLDSVKNGKFSSRIKVDMGLHAEYTNNDRVAKIIAEEAKKAGLNIHAHLSETEKEQTECKERHEGKTPAEFMENAGVLESQCQFAHCVYVTEEDEELLKKAGSFLIHNPSSNLKLGSGIAPVKRWVEKGLKVCIGTDGASSNNNLDMMEEIHVAALLCRGATKDANAVSAADIVKMATVNGALAQGRKDCGAIKVGNKADIIVFDLMTPNMQPDFDTLANVVFSAQSSNIVMNMIDGRVVYRDGNFAFINKEEVYKEVNERLGRIIKELAN